MKGSSAERLVSAGSDDFTMFLWELAVSKHPETRMTGHQQLVNHVYLWNCVTGKFVAAFRGHVGHVYQISRLLLSGSKDSTLKKLKQDLPGHADEVASGGKDRVLKLWMGQGFFHK